MKRHFYESTASGRSRLPTLAVFSIYQCIVPELKRYIGKELKPLASHTSPDFRSGDIGDIQINNEHNIPYEGVEIKFEKYITSTMVFDAYQKLKVYPVERYYILSTKPVSSQEIDAVHEAITMVRRDHGCQIIINGVLQTIKYYLRLIDDPHQWIDYYSTNVTHDPALKREHRELWRQLLESNLPDSLPPKT